MLYKFNNLDDAKTKAKEIVASGCDLEDGSLGIIESAEDGVNVYYVEDGCHMIRNHERVLWSL